MTKRINKKLIAFGLIAILVAVILLSALLLLLPNSNKSAVEGFSSIGQVLDVTTNDGKVDNKLTPSSDMVAISNETELNEFMSNNTSGGTYGYLTQDIVINRSATNYGLNASGFNKGRTLDGNGYKITITNNGTAAAYPTFANMTFGTGDDAITQNWFYNDNRQNPQANIKVSGGFIGVNWGTIKNVTFDYDIVSDAVYYTPASASNKANGAAHYIGVIAGLNMGYMSNTRLNITGKTFKFYRESTDNEGGNRIMAVVGGLAALNMGEIEGVTVDIASSVTFDVDSQTHDGWPTHAVLGGVVGKMLSYSGITAYNYISTAILRDVTMLGSGTFTIKGGNRANASSVLNEVGIVVGSNTVTHADKYRDSGANYDNGLIDGILMASTASISPTSGTSGSRGNHSNGTAQYPVLDCGKVTNVFYPYNYQNRVTNCNHSSTSTHNAQKYSLITLRNTPNIDTSKFELNLNIDRDKNIEDESFNINVSVVAKADAPAEYVVYRVEREEYSLGAGGAENWNSTTSLGGINYTNNENKITFWDDNALNNRKKVNTSISEGRASDTFTEGIITKTYIDLGQTAKITINKDIQPEAGSDYVLNYDGNAVSFNVVKDADASETNIYEEGSELLSNARLTSDGRTLNLSLREAKMPGAYDNAKIVSSLNENYGYLNHGECLVAPVNDIQETLGEGKTMRIKPVALIIKNPNTESTVYKEYTFNLETTFDELAIEYTMVTANGGLTWRKTDMNPSFPMYGLSSSKDGFSVSFAAYASYTYNINASEKETVIIAVTEETALRKLIIDVDAPEITYVDADGNTINKPNYDTQSWTADKQMLRFKASDAVSGVKSVTVDGTAVTAVNGIYSVEITNSKEKAIVITDNVGNVFTDTVRFKVDTTPVLELPDAYLLKGQTKTGDQKITFIVKYFGSECSIIMATRKAGEEWNTETIELTAGEKLDANTIRLQYTLSKHGTYEYKFNAVNQSGQVSADHSDSSFTLTINKNAIVLTSDDILYGGKLLSDSTSVGISKEYDGTTDIEADDFARFTWNPDSPNYAYLKDLSFTAQYKLADKGPNNIVVITPVDIDGVYDFTGSIEYTKASIMPKNLTIQINSATKAYGDLNPTFSYYILGLLPGDDLNSKIELTTDALANSGVGRYNIIIAKSKDEINQELKDSNYTVSVINNGVLTIESKVLDGDYRIVNSQVGANYTGRPVEVTAEYQFNGEWTPLSVRYYLNGHLLSSAPINVGTYTCELYTDDPNYSFTKTPTHEFTIHKAEVGIYIGEIGAGKTNYTVTYNGALVPLTIVIDNGDPNFTYVFKDSEGNTLTGQPINAGIYKLEVRCTPADTNLKETFKSFDFIINKADFSKLGVKFNNVKGEFNGNPYSINVTLPDIDYVLNGTTVVLRDAQGNNYNGAFSATEVGIYKITAIISNPNFETLELTAQLEIHKTILDEVKFVNTEFVYNGKEHTMSLDGLPEDATVSLTYKGDGEVTLGEKSISAKNAGNYLVVATISGDNYQTLTLTGTLKIAKADLPYTFDGITVNYDGKEHIMRPTVPEGIYYELTLTQTDEENIGGKVGRDEKGDFFSATRPNKYIVRLFINDSNYKQVTVTRTLNIEKLSLADAIKTSGYAVTFEPDKVYSFTITTEFDDIKLTVSCDKVGVVGDNNTLKTYNLPGAGTYRFTVTATKEFYKNYTTISTVTIYEADMPIQFVGANVHTYDGSDVLVSLQGLPKGAKVVWEVPEGVTLDKVENVFSVKNSGNYTVTAKVTAPNYKAKTISHTITIYDALMPDEMISSIKSHTFKYDGVGKVFEVVGAPEGAEITVNITNKAGQAINPIEGTNQYLILLPDEYTISVTVKATNYQDYTKTITWLVLNGDLNITAENKTYKYDGEGKSVELVGVPEGATVSFMHEDEVIPPVNGKYIFTRTEVNDYVVTYRVEMEHYNVVSGEMRLSIVKNDFSDVVIPNKVFTYTGSVLEYDISQYLPSDALLEYTLDDGVTRDGNKLSVTNVKLVSGLVSGYKVTVKFTKDNYEPKEITFTIKVERKDFDIVINDKTVTFNNEAHSLDISGVPEGAKVTYTYDKVTEDSFSATRAGQYYVTVNVTKKDGNHNDFSRVVVLTISKATLPQFYFGTHEFQWEPNHEDFVVNVVDGDGNIVDLSKYEITWTHKNGNVFNNAGTYRLSATYKLKGFENDYEIASILGTENAKSIDVVVKAKKITDNIFIDSADKTFDGKAVGVDIHNVPEGATVVWSTPRSYVDAGSYTVKALVSMPNYETREVFGFVTITALEVDIQYFVKPSYIAGETPRVVGRYTDVDGNVIDFTVDTASLRRAEEGEHEITVKKLDSNNYKPKEACNTVTIVIGNLMGTNNLGAIIGGAAGGAVALGGGIAALVVILMKKKSIKL